MAEQEKRKSGGSKLSRSETVTVRLDPKLRLAAELLAKQQRRTLSSLIEWAVENVTRAETVIPNWESKRDAGKKLPSAYDVAEACWDLEEHNRFLNMLEYAPLLLSYDEERLAKALNEVLFWFQITLGELLYVSRDLPQEQWLSRMVQSGMVRKYLRVNFQTIKDIAEGKADFSDLPDWKVTQGMIDKAIEQIGVKHG